jgi:hypothetical protein
MLLDYSRSKSALTEKGAERIAHFFERHKLSLESVVDILARIPENLVLDWARSDDLDSLRRYKPLNGNITEEECRRIGRYFSLKHAPHTHVVFLMRHLSRTDLLGGINSDIYDTQGSIWSNFEQMNSIQMQRVLGEMSSSYDDKLSRLSDDYY